MKQRSTDPQAAVSPVSVLRWADNRNQPGLTEICRRLLLPGSSIRGFANLRALVDLAHDGESCLICLNHRSMLDVPTLYALLKDRGEADLFDRIIWISGRKLEADVGMTSALVQCVNRVVVTPRTWFAAPHSEHQLHKARLTNIAAERCVARLRHEGWVFGLFPAGTRMRPDDESTRQAIEETYGYLRMFQFLVLCHIDGCTMPVSKDRDLTHETPRLDRVSFTFDRVRKTEDWLAEVVARTPRLDMRTATARAMTDDIEALSVPRAAKVRQKAK